MRQEPGGSAISLDFQALSLFRIAFSVYLLCDYFISTEPFFEDFYGRLGVMPIAALASAADLWPGLGLMLPLVETFDLARLPTLFTTFYVLAMVAFAIGYRTRWGNVLVFVGNSYLYWRNPYLNSGAGTLAHLLLLWCIFLPMGRYWSIDAALDPKPRDRRYPLLPFLAMRVQISSLYVFSGLFKLAGVPWRSGVALLWALIDNESGSTAAGLFLVHHAPWLLSYVTYLVIIFQLSFPLLVYCPWYNDYTRAFALAASAAMHASFIWCLNISGFPYLCIVMLLLLVPDAWINALLRDRRARLARMVIYYEPGCGFCQKVSLVLRELLLSPATPVLPASSDPQVHALLIAQNSWVVRGDDGKMYLKWGAVAYLLKQNVLLGPLAWIFELRPMLAVFNRLYDVIGSNRRRFALLANTLLPFRSDPSPGRVMLALCAILMIAAFLANATSLARLRFAVLEKYQHVAAALQVDQDWELFAPQPAHFRREYRIMARLEDASTVDLMQLLPRPLLQSNENGGIDFATWHWRKYFTRLDLLTEPQWAALARYLCRQAGAQAIGSRAIKQVEIDVTTQPAIAGTPPSSHPATHRSLDCAPAQSLAGDLRASAR